MYVTLSLYMHSTGDMLSTQNHTKMWYLEKQIKNILTNELVLFLSPTKHVVAKEWMLYICISHVIHLFFKSFDLDYDFARVRTLKHHSLKFNFTVSAIAWRIFMSYSIMVSDTSCVCVMDVALDCHYNDVRMGAIACQITSLTIVYSTVYSDAGQRKHQSGKCFRLMASSCIADLRQQAECCFFS